MPITVHAEGWGAVRLGPAPPGWDESDAPAMNMKVKLDGMSRTSAKRSTAQIAMTCFWKPTEEAQIIVSPAPGWGLRAQGGESTTYQQVFDIFAAQASGCGHLVRVELQRVSVAGCQVDLATRVGTTPKFRLEWLQHTEMTTEDIKAFRRGLPCPTEASVTCFWCPSERCQQLVVVQRPGWGLVATGGRWTTFQEVFAAYAERCAGPRVRLQLRGVAGLGGLPVDPAASVGAIRKFRLTWLQIADPAPAAQRARLRGAPAGCSLL
eukprot:m51a1_g12621 hypothetical protein (265) ;mRNA; f:858-2588